MHKLIDYVCKELEELEHKASKDGKLTMSELQTADTLAHLKKNLLKAEEMGGYSEYSMRDGGYSRDMRDVRDDYVRPDGSYARGRTGRVARDSMGRYSRDDELHHELEQLMHKAGDERTRSEIQKLMERL